MVTGLDTRLSCFLFLLNETCTDERQNILRRYCFFDISNTFWRNPDTIFATLQYFCGEFLLDGESHGTQLCTFFFSVAASSSFCPVVAAAPFSKVGAADAGVF